MAGDRGGWDRALWVPLVGAAMVLKVWIWDRALVNGTLPFGSSPQQGSDQMPNSVELLVIHSSLTPPLLMLASQRILNDLGSSLTTATKRACNDYCNSAKKDLPPTTANHHKAAARQSVGGVEVKRQRVRKTCKITGSPLPPSLLPPSEDDQSREQNMFKRIIAFIFSGT
jgi:hypothetical protein